MLSLGFYGIPRTDLPGGRRGLPEKQKVGVGEKQKAGDPASPYKSAGVAHFLRSFVVVFLCLVRWVLWWEKFASAYGRGYVFLCLFFSLKCYFSSGIFKCYQYGIRGKQGVGRRQLVVMYLVQSGEGSVIDRLRGNDEARATRRAEKQETGQEKNTRLGSGRVSIKGPAFSPFFLFFSSLDMKWDFFYLS